MAVPVAGDRERKEAEMEKEYRETLENPVKTGLLDDEPVSNALAINRCLVLQG